MEKKKITSCSILILVSLAFLASALGAQDRNLRVRVVSEQANIRVKPDISSEMLFQVPEGTEFQVEKKEGEWFLILFDRADGSKGKGYIHESLVEVISPSGVDQVTPVKKEKAAETRPAEPAREVKKPEARTNTTQKSATSGVTVTSVLKKMSLSVHGLLTYLSPSDLNQAAEGVTNYYYQTFGYERQADLSGIHFGAGYGLDLFYKFYPGLYIGLGFDYYQPSKNNRSNFTTNGTNYSVWTKVGVKDLPCLLYTSP
ncbi:MAG: SH3 domain-containing protein, partial [Methanosarcina sp.]|nr:SH3 domain-containing protein [Methanosarcina sp.]